MEPKFTKGPSYANWNDHFWEVGPVKGAYSQSHGQFHVNRPLGVDLEEAEANAHLYAAAPDMYAALDHIDRTATDIPDDMVVVSGTAYRLVRAALSRARGETK